MLKTPRQLFLLLSATISNLMLSCKYPVIARLSPIFQIYLSCCRPCASSFLRCAWCLQPCGRSSRGATCRTMDWWRSSSALLQNLCLNC